MDELIIKDQKKIEVEAEVRRQVDNLMREELDLLKMVSFGEISTYYLPYIYHFNHVWLFRLWKETKGKRVKLVRKRRRARREARRGKRRKIKI